jgi:predicted ATPase
MAELPSGTVTFLFTDLEGSTRLWEDLPEPMSAALARHDEILRDAVETHDGVVLSRMGDGIAAVFTSAPHAVATAVGVQQRLAAEAWGDSGPLRARLAIHTDEGKMRAPGEYMNQPLNRCARLMAVAHGGQVLISDTTAALTRGKLPEGTELLDLGEHRLRDLAEPMRVFQLVHPDLRREFPPIRSLDALPGNLPPQLTSFVGRYEEQEAIAKAVDVWRLLTLTGTGGVGKTRLAVQVAAEVLDRFADGAWFCELAAADDGTAMAQVISATLGCQQRAGLSLAESVVEYLNGRELLLILDNCEHLLDDASAFADAVVKSCPRVTVLVTSREALEVAGERVVRVRSLPAPAESTLGGELLESAAVQLFADRADEAGADRTWDDRQWAAVAEICRRVDGIPLAIELAAARTTAMSPADVAAHLDERFRLLTGKRRGRVERHQTLRATVDWSYQLLEEDERVVFDRLGVFAGTFDTAAAIAVAGNHNLDGWEVTDALSSLVAKSMLNSDTGPDGTTRYGMLETLRQFARERLDETADTDRWRRAHADHYATAAGDIGQGFIGPEHVLWVARLRADLDNVRAAVIWALERDDLQDQEVALRILAPLSVTQHGYADMGLGVLAHQAIDLAQASPPELRAPVLTLAAYYEWNQGRNSEARALAYDAQRDGIVVGTVDPFNPYFAAVVFEMAAGNHARALELAADTRAEIDSVDNYFSQSWFLSSVASMEALAGNFEQARVDAERALALARRLQNASALANALQGTAYALHRNDPRAALAAVEEFLDLYRTFGLGTGTANMLNVAGAIHIRLGDDIGALARLRDAITVARDQGVRPQLTATLDWSLGPLLRTGRPEVTATFLGALSDGALADVSHFPNVVASRSRNLQRVRDLLGDQTDTYVARGAAMTYNELTEYAIAALESNSASGAQPAPPGGAISQATAAAAQPRPHTAPSGIP